MSIKFRVRLPRIALTEPVSKTMTMSAIITKVYEWKRTKYQEVAIVDLAEFGRTLVIDGFTQVTQLDEYIYHESLVHPAMISHPNPRKILIVGGGEGGALREVLKHNTVEKVLLVDIDEEVINLSKKYLECVHQNSFYDSRVEIVIDDGLKFIGQSKPKAFDVVILDLTDPYGSIVAEELYTSKTFKKILKILKDDGIMVTQAGSSFFFKDVYDSVLSNLRSVFPIVREYNVWVPSYGYACNFIIGSKKYDPKTLSINEINKRIKERKIGDLKFYSAQAHQAFFIFPIYKPHLDKAFL